MTGVPYIERDFPFVRTPLPDETAQQRFLDARDPAGFFRSTTATVANPGGYWVLTDYDLVREAFQTPTVFSSELIQVDVPLKSRPSHIPTELDPPEHTRFRKMLLPAFTPKRAQDEEPLIRRTCREVVEKLATQTRCDLQRDFANVFPTSVFQDLLGIPHDDNDRFLAWVADMWHGKADKATAAAAHRNIMNYFAEVVRAESAAPGDNLIGFIVQTEIEGPEPTFDELVELCFLIFAAAHDTVPCMLGYTFRYFAENPADRARVIADPGLIPGAVEEMLRYYSVGPPARVIARDIDFHGCPMKAGERVWLATPAADRDPKQFVDADRVDIGRSVNPHLAFGGGPHRCLGSHLARLEMQIALEEWHRLIPDYHVDPSVPITEHGGVLGLDNLPLVLGS